MNIMNPSDGGGVEGVRTGWKGCGGVIMFYKKL